MSKLGIKRINLEVTQADLDALNLAKAILSARALAREEGGRPQDC